MIFIEFLIIYLMGSVLYGSIELLYRGWTHWTMLVLGGMCFCVMYLLSGTSLPLIGKLLLSAFSITALEFCTGYLVNITLGWQVWDYSAQPLNLMGQVCPLFSLFWLLLSFPGLYLCSFLRRAIPILVNS